jgi:AraC-like DNA-binding protein
LAALRVVAIGASHLKATFKRTTGLAVHEYIVHRRVHRAKQLLTAGQLPASQVALAAGFSHQSHMARWMRRLLGRTPSSFAAAMLCRGDLKPLHPFASVSLPLASTIKCTCVRCRLS